jgi:hypothetical protein
VTPHKHQLIADEVLWFVGGDWSFLAVPSQPTTLEEVSELVWRRPAGRRGYLRSECDE